ncbi:hypothetical protein CEP52_000052 [Fusarium oligoseptatum]|uniref:Uncharacterized protein n=1 Tax=Fusarium oligoseptatum TaxID=2604345 RepID=A0A428UQM1_9HYPO|nr:hypothetical protein CEP52_000052 [Fusarium oligoseptatum]
MPFVGEDIRPGIKRRLSDDHEATSYRPDQPKDFYLLNQRSDLTSRKILPLTKRARITEDDILAHDNFTYTNSHRRRRSSQLKMMPVQPVFASRPSPRATGAVLAPCHICHRKPTKKSDLDSFAECQGCETQCCQNKKPSRGLFIWTTSTMINPHNAVPREDKKHIKDGTLLDTALWYVVDVA